GYEMALRRAPQPPFELYESEITHKRLPQWRNSQLFVESTIQVYHELQAFTQEISIEQARDEAKARALQSVQQIIPESAQILARNIEILKLNEPNLVRIKVGVETVEDIGISQMISQ
ncbi:sporulation protein YqfD, partial [Anaerospora hongkongensis]|uniref:sporulation protein YqfD n=1 Tax=Anaerospora hongkongensis TaxID=244830 RepID=UPI002FDA69A5